MSTDPKLREGAHVAICDRKPSEPGGKFALLGPFGVVVEVGEPRSRVRFAEGADWLVANRRLIVFDDSRGTPWWD